jgi:zinc transporter, ZIP family
MFAMLSFAAGVMLTISFTELIPEALEFSSIQITALGIIVGGLIMFAMDKIIPHIHPHLCRQEHGKSLEKTALYLIVGIFLHNLPEGLAIGIVGISNLTLSFSVAIAIAIHNISEGICTAAPYYCCSKKNLVIYAFITYSSSNPCGFSNRLFSLKEYATSVSWIYYGCNCRTYDLYLI